MSYLPLQRSSTLSLNANSSASVSRWAEARETERRRRSMVKTLKPMLTTLKPSPDNRCLEYLPPAYRKCISGSCTQIEITFTDWHDFDMNWVSEDLCWVTAIPTANVRRQWNKIKLTLVVEEGAACMQEPDQWPITNPYSASGCLVRFPNPQLGNLTSGSLHQYDSKSQLQTQEAW